MPPRTQPNIYFVAFNVEILQMSGKSVRWLWTAQNRAFPRIVSRCATFPAAPARPAAVRHFAGRLSRQDDTRGRPPWAVRLRLGGMGAGECKAGASRELALRIPKTQKRPPSLSKNPAKNKKAIFNFIKAPFGCCLMCCNIHKMRVSIL